jgi:membrane associated rhomboid family serine protease
MLIGVLLLLVFIAAIWVIEVVNLLSGHRLDVYGIVPRTVDGLKGIPFAPFLHGGVHHALSNTVPLLILGGFITLQGWRAFLGVSLFVIIVGGAGVWLAGRSAIHIGASGLVFGYFGYLLARGWYNRSVVSILVALAVLILYGGMIFGILPTSGFVSWEGHLFGLLAGILAARLGRRKRDQKEQEQQ